jgi:hypothetical protein
MGEIVGKFRLDAEQALNNLRQLAAESVKIETAMNKAGKSAEDSFIKGSNGAKRLETELKKQPKTLAEMELKLQRLKELLRDDTKIGTDGFKKIRTEIEKTEKEINGLNGKLKTTGNEMSGLGSMAKKVGGMLVAAFAVDRIIEFGKEVVMLAAKTEGVERAFKRIGSPQLLQGLRDATRGTVSDLTLMTTAVQASNFKIPLEELATYLKFATQRANETGKSVDYMVESILTGVGRGSIDVWDNLGFSLGEVRQHLNGVAVESLSVGERAKLMSKLVNAELVKMGDQADTTADKIAQLGTSWENLKTQIGGTIIDQLSDLELQFNETGVELGKLNEDLEGFNIISFLMNNALKALASPLVALNELILKAAKAANLIKEGFITLKDEAMEAAYRLTLSNEELIEFWKLSETARKIVVQQAFGLKDYADFTDDATRATAEFNKQVAAIELSNDEVENNIRNVAFLEAAIKALKDERSRDATTRERILSINKELIPLEEELALLLGQETDAQKKLREELEKIAKIREQVFTGAEMADGIPIVVAMQDTLKGLNELLKEQHEILKESPEFSKQYDEASAAIDKLEKKIKEFNDDFIDPSEGFPDINTKGIDDEKGTPPPVSDEDLKEWQLYADAVISLNNLITSAVIAGHNKEIESLDRQLDAGLISRTEYDKKRRALERKKAASEKESAIYTAVINTATAVLSALNTQPFLPLGPIMAGIAGALGAVQIGVIAAQPLPQFAEGVIGLQGAGSETSDSIHAKLSRGESVMTAAETKQYKDELWAIRKGNFENLIMTKYVKPMIDESIFKGFADIGRSAELNGITANLKDHNIIHGLDRLRQSQQQGFKYLAKELKVKNQKRGGYRA